MNILKLSFVLSFFLFSFSCKKGSEDTVNIDARASILLLNNQSKNLLSEPVEIKYEDINIYYMIDGKKVLQYHGNLDYPKMFRIIQDKDGENILDVYLNITNEAMPVTLISFSDSETDTIRSEYRREKGSVICTKIWYNDELKFDINTSSDHRFTVIK